jgi:ketosteroid isomerase-like protein
VNGEEVNTATLIVTSIQGEGHMRWVVLLVVVLWAGTMNHGAAQTDVKAAADAFDHAQQVGDRATLERMLADDRVFIRMSGVLAGKAQFVETFTTTVALEPFEITNRTFVPLGAEAAIVGGEARMRGTRDGQPFAQHFRYSDVFLRHNGEWKVVHVQVTAVP